MTATFVRTSFKDANLSNLLRQDWESTTELRSPEGKQITQRAAAIRQDLIQHLKATDRIKVMEPRSFSVRVRYKFVGRGEPLPYSLE